MKTWSRIRTKFSLNCRQILHVTSKLAVLQAHLQAAPLQSYSVVEEIVALRGFLKPFLTCVSLNESSPLGSLRVKKSKAASVMRRKSFLSLE